MGKKAISLRGAPGEMPWCTAARLLFTFGLVLFRGCVSYPIISYCHLIQDSVRKRDFRHLVNTSTSRLSFIPIFLHFEKLKIFREM